MIDTIVNEVRKYRMEHTQKFGGKLSEICKDLRRFQETCGHQVVRLPPRRIKLKAIAFKPHKRPMEYDE
jgi:hypothetical protein